MKRIGIIAVAGLLSLAAYVPSHAGMSFEVTQGFNLFNDDRVEGQNRHIGVNFDVNDSVTVGIYMERADLQLDGDIGVAVPNTIGLEFDAQAVRVEKTFSKWLAGGIDLGSAQIQQGAFTGGFLATPTLNQTKPFVGIHGKLKHSIPVKDKISTDMHLTLGYRFLDLNDVTIGGAPAGESTLDDLNSLIVGVGFGFSF